MKAPGILLLILVLFSNVTLGQKKELINSGELIKAGGVLYDSSQYKKAILLFDQVSRSDTNYVWSLYEKAISCEADSQYNNAVKYCQEALSLKEQREYEPDLYNTYGNTLSDMGQHEQAIKVFDIALKKYPLYSLLYFNKGVCELALKHYDKAEALFQKTLLINPYMYSAHYQLAITAINQGKLIPAFLSGVGYLLVNPQGRYWAKCINLLNAISKSTDEVLEYKNKRTISPDDNYQTVEDIVLSKIALDKQYKPIIALDDAISRQIQVVFEKLQFTDADKDFWIQYYLPYYKKVYNNGNFEPFINHIFSNAKVAVIQDYNKKNKKLIEAFENGAGDYFNLIRSTNELYYSKRDSVTLKYVYENGKLEGRGIFSNNGKILTGKWEFYYPAGNLKSVGSYDAAGKRYGEWRYYFYTGQLKAIERFATGNQEGVQEYYYDNGNLSSREYYSNGQANGLVATYYYSGSKKSAVNYKLGKKDGEVTGFYPNGNIKSVNIFSNGLLNGPFKEYYKSGTVNDFGQYANDKLEGEYKSFYEDGKLSAEMTFTNDKVNGEWKSYYESGKLKERRNYINNTEDGLHEEFYENGQIATSYPVQKGKVNGDAISYTKEGTVYSKYTNVNGVVKVIKYLNKTGAELSSAEVKGGLIDVVSYNTDGIKDAHFFYNNKGVLTGPDTIFYSSGKVRQVKQYHNDALNGNSVAYFINGKKKTEINIKDDKDHGYYQRFYSNGQAESEGWIQEGDYQGEWVYHDEQGKLTSRSNYLNSDLNGYKQDFDADGHLLTEQKYYKGVLQQMKQFDAGGKVMAIDSFPKGSGKFTLLFPKGQKMEQCDYVNGNFNGSYKTYYFDGSLQSVFFYKNGVLDSTYRSYYYGGAKHNEGQYKFGGKAGIWKTYSEEGVLTSAATYANDELNGEHIIYNPDGSKDFVSIYKDDVLDGPAQKYDPDGTLAYQTMFDADSVKAFTHLGKDGKLLPYISIASTGGHFKTFYPNGKTSRECAYTDGVKNGQVVTYFTNGQLRTVDTITYGVTEGISKEFYADGKLMSESPYLNDNLNGTYKEYYKTGNLKKEIPYINGISMRCHPPR